MKKLFVSRWSKSPTTAPAIRPSEISMAEFKGLVEMDFEEMPKFLRDDEEKVRRMTQCLESLVLEGECIFQRLGARVVVR